MIPKLENLIEALREELQQYGEMLARLDQQQEMVIRRAADDLLMCVAGIEEQVRILHAARKERQVRQRALALHLGLDQNATFAELIPSLLEDYRPLVGALVQENNELLVRVQQRTRQNHLLLSRSLDLMQRFMNSLFGFGTNPVYNETGGTRARVLPSRPLYEAVG